MRRPWQGYECAPARTRAPRLNPTLTPADHYVGEGQRSGSMLVDVLPVSSLTRVTPCDSIRML